jgi:ankyrin repeat protein
LCSRGASMEVTDKYDYTVLMQAIQDKHGTILEELCRSGAKVNGTNSRGSTPLLEACASSGNYHAVETLCYYGANVNAIDENGWSPLMYITKNQDLSVLNVLLSLGPDVNFMNDKGESAMRIACSNRRRRWRDNEDNDDNREEIIATLAEFGAFYDL